MKTRHIATTLAMLGALAVAAPVFAANPNTEFYPFSELMSMNMIDKNKDGMVSKKEFMDMMDKAWDMNAKKMNAKGDKMSSDQFKEFMMYLKAGG